MLRAWAVFQLFDLGVLGYGLDLRCWVAIAIIVSLTDHYSTSILRFFMEQIATEAFSTVFVLLRLPL